MWSRNLGAFALMAIVGASENSVTRTATNTRSSSVVSSTVSSTKFTTNPNEWLLRDCKAHWDSVVRISHDSVFTVPFTSPTGGYALPGAITHVPEYHDCQRFIVDKKWGPITVGKKYGAHIAVFVAYDAHMSTIVTPVPSDPPGVVPGGATPLVQTTGTAFSAVLILNMGQPYGPLKIRTGFSCLYTWQDAAAVQPAWRAKIVYVGIDDNRCLKPVSKPDTLTGYELQVRVLHPSGFINANQYPQAARWDWDSKRGEQYIGVACGNAWCDIGRKDFTSSKAYLNAPGSVSLANQVQSIKGWYDEQLLANPGSGGPIPTKLKGTVIPDTSLGNRTAADYGVFLPVAYIALSNDSEVYRKKLNLYKSFAPNAPLDSLNRLFYCYNTKEMCGVPADDGSGFAPTTCDLAPGPPKKWWVRIDPAKPSAGRRSIYRCVTPMDHPGLTRKTPSTVRWRWLDTDETVWRECLNGCCKVEVIQ